MTMKALTKCVVAVAVLFLAIGQAQATTYNLTSLTDLPGTYNSGSFTSGSTVFNNWSVSLSGLGAGFTAYQGDTVNATITLSSAYTTEIGANNSWLYLGLYGDNSSGYNTQTQATTTFYYNGTQVGLYTGTIITSQDWLPAGVVLYPPDSLSAITFNQVTIDYTIGQIGSGGSNSLNLTDATLYAQGQSPAPVPIPAPLLLLGPCLAGLAAMRKRIRM
jgi:hypothetical protein